MDKPRIGVVGPCAAGKTTLVAALRQLGFDVRHIAQEHSYVPDMWQRISKPEILIFLHVSYQLTLVRRQMNWNESEYNEQIHRLRHARAHADIFIDTDSHSPEEVLEQVMIFIDGLSI